MADTFTCLDCGSLVTDEPMHTYFHAQVNAAIAAVASLARTAPDQEGDDG